jgi:hypothetical protein
MLHFADSSALLYPEVKAATANIQPRKLRGDEDRRAFAVRCSRLVSRQSILALGRSDLSAAIHLALSALLAAHMTTQLGKEPN